MEKNFACLDATFQGVALFKLYLVLACAVLMMGGYRPYSHLLEDETYLATVSLTVYAVLI
jgi:hypothetical protein